MATWRRQPPQAQWLPQLRQWSSGENGRRLMAAELDAIGRSCADEAYAFRQCLLSPLDLDVEPALPAPAQPLRLGSALQQHYQANLDSLCSFEALPIATDTQDLVLVQHVLEFADNPHQVLREVERIVAPRGRLIVSCFNPVSYMGLRIAMGRMRGTPLWQQHFLQLNRLKDWLALLGFETDSVQYVCHRPGWIARQSENGHDAFPGLCIKPEWKERCPLGGSYVLTAVKHRAAIRPQKPRWSRDALANVRPIAAGRGLSPTTRDRFNP